MRGRILCLLLVFLFVLGGCSTTESGAGEPSSLDPENPVTITLWHYYLDENKIALEQAVSRFNQTVGMERGVIVEVVAKGTIAELEEAVTNSAEGIVNAAPMPNIFSSYPDKAMEIDAMGMLCDLNAYFTQEEKDRYVADFLADDVFEGERLLLLPIVKSTEVFYLNATGWEEFAKESNYSVDGLGTWEGIYDAARAYYQWTDAQTPEQAGDGRSFMGFDSVANYIIVGNKQLGVDIIDAKGNQVILDRKVLNRVFSNYYNGFSLGYFNAISKFRSDDIKAGGLISYVGSTSGAAYFPTWIEEDNQQIDIDFLPLAYPVFEGGEAYAIQQGASMCIAKASEQEEEGSALFLKWFTSEEENITFAMSSGYLPVQQSAYSSVEFENALVEMEQGNPGDRNVAQVYKIALGQITRAKTYAAKPFEGSYRVRALLQKLLLEEGLQGRQVIEDLKGQALSESELLEHLNTEAAFERFLSEVEKQLEDLEITSVMK